MDLKKLEVQELLNLDDIESEEMLYLKKYGYFPFNVSTWNPSSYFSQKFLDHQLELPSLDYISYIYSYEMFIASRRTSLRSLQILQLSFSK